MAGRDNLCSRQSRVDDPDPARVGSGPLKVGAAHAFKEGRTLRLEAVRCCGALPRTRKPGVDGNVQQQRTGWPQIAVYGGRKLIEQPRAHPPPRSLVGVAGIRETIADHPATGGQGRAHGVIEVHGARCEHQQRLRHRTERLVIPAQEQFAHALGQRRTARLARLQQRYAVPLQLRLQRTRNRALAGAFDAFQRDELRRFHFLPPVTALSGRAPIRLRYRSSAALCCS